MTRLLFIKQEILPKGGLEKYTKKTSASLHSTRL